MIRADVLALGVGRVFGKMQAILETIEKTRQERYWQALGARISEVWKPAGLVALSPELMRQLGTFPETAEHKMLMAKMIAIEKIYTARANYFITLLARELLDCNQTT